MVMVLPSKKDAGCAADSFDRQYGNPAVNSSAVPIDASKAFMDGPPDASIENFSDSPGFCVAPEKARQGLVDAAA
jgi:hypothetical protein